MRDTALTFLAAQAQLARLDIDLQIAPGEYVLNYRHGTPSTARYTDDLDAALIIGRAMADDPGKPRPYVPPGPTGRQNSRKATMYRHNAKLAAHRRTLGRNGSF